MMRGSIYPSWRYHPDGRSELCLTPERDAELGDEAWSDKDVRRLNGTVLHDLTDEEPLPAPQPDEPPKRKPGRPRKES